MRTAILFVAVCAGSCFGCAATKPNSSQSEDNGRNTQVFVCAPACSDQEASAAIKHAFDQCTRTQNGYEKRGFNSKTAQFTVAAIGALAGAVAAPVAKGSAAKAWSGLSGASNGIQGQLDEQYSYAVTVQDRVAVSNAMKEGEERIRSAKTPFDRMFEAESMENECRQAAAKADAAVLQALASAAKIAADNDQQVTDATKKQVATTQNQPASSQTAPSPAQTTDHPSSEAHPP